MTLKNILTTLLFCLAVSTAQAGEAENLRKTMTSLKGEELIKAYFKLYGIR